MFKPFVPYRKKIRYIFEKSNLDYNSSALVHLTGIEFTILKEDEIDFSDVLFQQIFKNEKFVDVEWADEDTVIDGEVYTKCTYKF